MESQHSLELTRSSTRFIPVGLARRFLAADVMGLSLGFLLGAADPQGRSSAHKAGWAVYAVQKGVARMRAVKVGRRNGAQAQIVGGLRAGEQLVVYPGDNVVDGAKVEGR